MGLRTYITKRLLSSLVLLLLAMSFNFYLFMVMPQDPTELFVPARGITVEKQREMIATFRAVWGLDQPLYIQYFVYLRKMFMWDFGTSLVANKPIAGEILYRLPWTLILMGGSGVIAILVGVVLGVLVAYKRGSKFDIATLITSLVTGSLPVFWMGMIYILIFTTSLKWFPNAHAYPDGWGLIVPWPQAFSTTTQVTNGVVATYQISGSGLVELLSGYAQHAFLPILTLSVFQFGGYVLLARATMLESLTEDYIVTARAKGVNERSVLFKHALKNASLPLITAVALHFGFILSGAIITETVFTWPGLGYWIFTSVGLSDYFNMQAIFYIISLCVILANVVADLLYGIVDPRVKYG